MNKEVTIEISGHHCHISRQDLDLIYGQDYQLKPIKKLSQVGQYAAEETVTIQIGDKKIEGIRILGPERKNTQIEISLTEAYKLATPVPITECTKPGQKDGGSKVTIIGPKGKIERQAAIAAYRHFHTDPKTAKKLGLKDKQKISLKTTGLRSLTFHNVLVRIDPSFKSSIHLDTDEANAAGLKPGQKGKLIIKNK